MNKFIIYLSFTLFVNISNASEINYLDDIDTFNSDGTVMLLWKLKQEAILKMYYLMMD